jgi:hypothetical protein
MDTGIVPQTATQATDFVPEVFGRLTTLDAGYMVDFGTYKKKCHRVLWADLRAGKNSSCGCLQKELFGDANRTHGLSKIPEYRMYHAMLDRCYRPSNTHYPDYGGRGIGVFPEWLGPGGFERWLAYIGPRPKGMTQDRFPNPDGNYEPGNVRWATSLEQGRNKRNNIWLTLGDKTRTQAEWSRETGINVNTIARRRKRGLSVEEILAPK